MCVRFRLQRNLAIRNISNLSVEIAEKKQTVLLHQLRRHFGNMQLQPNGNTERITMNYIKNKIHLNNNSNACTINYFLTDNVQYDLVLFAGGLHELSKTADTETRAFLLRHQRRNQKSRFHSRIL